MRHRGVFVSTELAMVADDRGFSRFSADCISYAIVFNRACYRMITMLAFSFG